MLMKNENTKKQARELPSASSEELEAELLKRKLSENIFPLDVFPSEISGFVDVLVNKKLDRGYIGTAILTAFASVIGNRFVSTTPDGFAVKSILWSAIVGISSGGKSITQNLVYKALNELQRKLESQYTDDAPKKRLVVGKGTHEALFKEIIPDNPQGILRFEDELRGWLEGIGQYSRNRGAEETDFISLFDGSKVEVNRSQRKTFIIEKPYMSLTGSTQNYFLKRFLEEGLTKSGLTNRFFRHFPSLFLLCLFSLSLSYGRYL